MKQLLERIEKFWCTHMHEEIMWPNHGSYRCRTCLRTYPVEFDVRTEVLGQGRIAESFT